MLFWPAGDIDSLQMRLQQAEQVTDQSRQLEAQTVSCQAQIASLQEECAAKGSQVRLLDHFRLVPTICMRPHVFMSPHMLACMH